MKPLKWECLSRGDSSIHDWCYCGFPFPLIIFLDDKSRYVLYAQFVNHDDLEAHRKAWITVIKTFGIPRCVYYDNDAKYAKGGSIRKALEELGVQVINTRPYEPQGKGKVERAFQTFQKQLPCYIKRKKPQTLEEFNKLLEWYVDKDNNTVNREMAHPCEAL